MLWARRRREPEFSRTVYVARDRASVLLVRVLLDSAGIGYVVTGDIVQEFFGWGRLGTGWNNVTGPVRFAVKAEEAEVVVAILGELSEVHPNPIPLLLRLFAVFNLCLSLSGIFYSLIRRLWLVALRR